MAETTSQKDRLTEKLAAGVPDRSVKLAYGEKQTVDGAEIIPVAFVTYGFGGGEDLEQLGSGGGGGGVAIPLGAYVRGPSGLRFQPNQIAVLAAAIPLVSTIAWGISLIVKAARR
ncbi:hypothetical protein LH407_03535 [Antiquaquibacter oligotrophicus]|nr:hypothetical protein [Antiquaquibacter oligotrophicus]UDF13939.1 hypothetical protein LH407_03535 [Antiquaquibacter oligotrophicus]